MSHGSVDLAFRRTAAVYIIGYIATQGKRIASIF
jgi:hypothetical protein